MDNFRRAEPCVVGPESPYSPYHDPSRHFQSGEGEPNSSSNTTDAIFILPDTQIFANFFVLSTSFFG